MIIYTEWMGRSPDLVEDQITYPLTTSLLSVPKSKVVRGFSFFDGAGTATPLLVLACSFVPASAAVADDSELRVEVVKASG